MTDLSTTCCIAGGGPAGMMLGLLLARAGVPVVVLEKHGDFLRDFRGDTIHPSTLELMHELGLLEKFLRLPHDEVSQLSAQIGERIVKVADLSHLPTRCKVIAFMPQWEFLNFLAQEARAYPTFTLLLETQAQALSRDGAGTIDGVLAVGPQGPFRIAAALTIGADGRNSTLRQAAGLAVEDLGAPMDVLWLRLSRKPDDPPQSLGRVAPGHLFIMLDRGDYWQCAFIIEKGGLEALKAQGLEAFREKIVGLAPVVVDRIGEIAGWDDAKLLTVKVDRLRHWSRPGLLCIGDAAHAMSPIGGVGINLAIQDAVATANLLWRPLVEGRLTPGDLEKVQARRQWPAKATQWIQVQLQNRAIAPALRSRKTFGPPWPLRLLERFALLRRLPARLIGMGVRPEHIRSPARVST